MIIKTPTKTAVEAISVSDYLAVLNAELQQHRGRIIGEVSECKMVGNGHVFFSLRDKGGEAILSCAIWASSLARVGIELENGMEIVVNGVPNVYVKNGRFSFIASSFELVGEGALRKQYEKLKAKLAAEGLFSKERKRKLPAYPKTIGVITSTKGGVVIYDYTSNLKKYGFESRIVDSRVEGPDAVKELLESVRTLKKENIDVLVLIRGGGSLESFAPFNNEVLVREIVNFPVPVIVGVGHDVDICLVGMAADIMVSTPTAVANLLNESWDRAIYSLDKYKQGLLDKFDNLIELKRVEIQNSSTIIKDKFNSIFDDFRKQEATIKTAVYRVLTALESKKNTLQLSSGLIKDKFNSIFERFRNDERNLKSVLYKFDVSLKHKRKRISEGLDMIIRIFEGEIVNIDGYLNSVFQEKIYPKQFHGIRSVKQIVTHSNQIILQNDPARQLKLGYSIVTHNNKILKSISDVDVGESVSMRVVDGTINSVIKEIIK